MSAPAKVDAAPVSGANDSTVSPPKKVNPYFETTSSFFGRTAKVLDNATGFQKVAKLIISVGMIFISVFPTRFFSSAFAPSQVAPGAFSLDALNNRVTTIDLAVDVVQIPGDLKHVIDGEYSKDIKNQNWCRHGFSPYNL